MSKLDGIKAGDRVRVTLEGVVDDIADCVTVVSDARMSNTFYRKEIEEQGFQITRIEPPFKVGDEVVQFGFDQKNTVVAVLSDGRLVVEYQTGDTTNVVARDPSCFTRA